MQFPPKNIKGRLFTYLLVGQTIGSLLTLQTRLLNSDNIIAVVMRKYGRVEGVLGVLDCGQTAATADRPRIESRETQMDWRKDPCRATVC